VCGSALQASTARSRSLVDPIGWLGTAREILDAFFEQLADQLARGRDRGARFFG
jgi:hypothetical protein